MENPEEEEDIFNFRGKTESFVAQTWGKFKTALLGTLFVMGEELNMGHTMFLIGQAIDFVQLLAFPFNDNSEFPWNPYYTNFFIWLANNSEEKLYISVTSKTHNAIVYAVVFSLVALNLVVTMIVGYRFSKNQVQNPLMLKFVRGVCTQFSTILYLPLLSLFALICACSLGYQQFQACPDHLPPLFFIISSLAVSVVFGLVAFVVVVSFYDQDPTSDGDSARPHARLELFILLAKAVYTMQFGLFGTPEYMIPCLITLLVLGCLSCTLYILYIPMYSFVNAVRQAQYHSAFFWAALCLGFCIAENEPDDGAPSLLYYFGSVSMWIIAKFVCEWRANALLHKTIDTVRNSYEVELATRFLLLSRFKTLNPENMEELPEYRATLDYIEEFFFEAERKFPNSCMLQMFIAQFYQTYRHSISDSAVKMAKASRLQPFIDVEFVIYKHEQNSNKQHAGSDVVRFVTFNTYMQAAHRAEINAMKGQVQFWGELAREEEPSIARMVDLSKIISGFVGEANLFYSLLMKLDPNHAKLLHMYGFFLSDVKNDDTQSVNLHNRAEGLEGSKEKDKFASVYERPTQSVRLVLSTDKGNFGRIEKASPDTFSLLRVPKTFVINELIENFIPPNISIEFILFLKRSLEFLVKPTDQRVTSVALLDGSGFVILFKCIVRPHLQGADTDLCNTLPSPQDTIERLYEFGREERRLNKATPQLDSLHVECELVPVDDSDCSLFVNMDGGVMFLSRSASRLTGILPDFNTHKNIRDVIFMYDRYFSEAMERTHVSVEGSVTQPPCNTFVVSSLGKFSRVTISVIDWHLQRDTIILIKMKELGNFDRKTQLFMDMFAHFLKAYFGKALQMQFDGLKSLQLDHIFSQNTLELMPVLRKSKESQAHSVFSKLQEKVMAANTVFSPELRKLSLVLLLFLALLGVLQLTGFILVEILFEVALEDLNIIAIATDVQYQSLSVSAITLWLDLARRGLDVGSTPDVYLEEMNATLGMFSAGVERLQTIQHLSSLLKNDIPMLSKEASGAVRITLQNSLESCRQQKTMGIALVQKGLPAFDVLNDPDAFFVYENGRRSMAKALLRISEEAVQDTGTQRYLLSIYLVVFTVLQCLLILAGLFTHTPLALLVERVHIDVIGVFFAMPKNVVSYLHKTASTNLQHMQNNQYPDNKVKLMNEEGQDLEMFRLRTVRVFRGGTTLEDRRKRLIQHGNRFSRKLISLLKNPVTQRIAVSFAFLFAYVLLLEMYLGQFSAYTSIADGPYIVQSIGLLKAYMLQQSLAGLGVIYNQPSNSSIEDSFYSFESLETSKTNCFRQSRLISRYLSMLRVGDDSLSIPYDVIYEQQKSEFFSEFFLSGCVVGSPGDCAGFDGGVMNMGLYGAARVYQSDVEATTNV